MGLQDTASKTSLLLACQRPFASETELDSDEPGEPARYGSAFHEGLERRVKGSPAQVIALAAKYEVPPEGLGEHISTAEVVLRRWLDGDNPYRETFLVCATEVHLATRLRKHKSGQIVPHSRVCDFDPIAHHYDLRPREFGGTFDALLQSSARQVVLDYKTGDYGDFSRPSQLPQMLTLALQTGASAVAILHAPRGLPPVMYCEELTHEQIFRHAHERRRAMLRVGDGSLRPTEEGCRYCRAKGSCPAKDGELLKRSTALVSHVMGSPAPMATVEDLGRLHLMLGEYDKLSKRVRSEMKARVAAGEVVERPDGKSLRIETRSYERLSKASIEDALGKQKGAVELERLRKLGCLTTDEREELHAR